MTALWAQSLISIFWVIAFVAAIGLVRSLLSAPPRSSKREYMSRVRAASYRREFERLHGAPPKPLTPVEVSIVEPDRSDAVTISFSQPFASFDHHQFEKDAWDPWFPPKKERLRVTAELHIVYLDAENQCTERDITVRYIGENHAALNAFCHMRQGNRTFRNERILRCVDRTTGEVMHDVWAVLHARASM